MISLYVNALLCMLQHIVIHAMQPIGVNSENWHRWVASRVWQFAAACTKVHWRKRRSFSASSLTVSTLHLHLFNFLYRVRDLRPHWSTRRRTGFSCATLYEYMSYLLLPRLVWFLLVLDNDSTCNESYDPKNADKNRANNSIYHHTGPLCKMNIHQILIQWLWHVWLLRPSW